MRRLPLYLVALVALLAAACSSSTGFVQPPAATVNGTDISKDSVIADLDALGTSDAVKQNLESQGVELYGPTEGSYSAEVSAQVLSSRIIDVLIEQEMKARGVEPTPEDITEAESSFEGFEELPQDFKDRQIASIANRTALTRAFEEEPVDEEPVDEEPVDTGEVTDEEVRAYYDENVASYLEQTPDVACASHILVATQEEAEAAAARLDAGEDFATVAAELSTDTASGADGGNLGCQSTSGYVAEFKTAIDALPIGEVSDPVQTEFGFHLILVRSRGELPFEEVEESLRAQLTEERASAGAAAGTTAFDEWLQQAVTDADVTVDPFFGTWTPDTYPSVVTPPEGSEPASDPADTTTTSLP